MKNTFIFILALFVVGCSKSSQKGIQDSSPVFGIRQGTIAGSPMSPSGPFSNIVPIYRKFSNQFEVICTGSVISSHLVLTSASCLSGLLQGDEISDYAVGVPGRIEGMTATERASVNEVEIHPDYRFEDASGNPELSTPDVALISVHSDEFARFPFLEITSSDDLSTTDELFIAGFGVTALSASVTGTRRTGRVNFSQFSDLNRYELNSLLNRTLIEDGAIKVVPGPDNQLPCAGDEGSPLISDGKIIGVYSSSGLSPSPSCEDQNSAYYSRLSEPIFSSFIEYQKRVLDPQGQCQSENAFVSADGGCKHLASGLVWAEQTQILSIQRDFTRAQAQALCAQSNEGSQNRWRLPTSEEMRLALYEGARKALSLHVEDSNSSFWVQDLNVALGGVVNFQSGQLEWVNQNSTYKAICVRE